VRSPKRHVSRGRSSWSIHPLLDKALAVPVPGRTAPVGYRRSRYDAPSLERALLWSVGGTSIGRQAIVVYQSVNKLRDVWVHPMLLSKHREGMADLDLAIHEGCLSRRAKFRNKVGLDSCPKLLMVSKEGKLL